MTNIIKKIASDLCLNEEYVKNIIARADYFYRNYKILKRNGTKRLISQAGPELKTLQYWVVSNILSKLPVSNSAFAYRKGLSIKNHANYHIGAKHILHVDIKNFFPSIHDKHLKSIMDENKNLFKDYDITNLSYYVNKICFRSNTLCIGTVSSPMLSNVIIYNFDEALSNYCRERDMKYSRYSDDFYISSSNYIPTKTLEFIESELNNLGFEINETKTKFFSNKYRQRVTGLILTEQRKISIGKERKDKIKKIIYEKLKHNNGVSAEIIGYLSFLKDVEPTTYNNLIIKYSKYTNIDIVEALKSN